MNYFLNKENRKEQKPFRFLFLACLFFTAFINVETINSQTATEEFNANGTFTVPAGVTSITVECWGGGGAGGGTNSNNARGGGGGAGGAYARSVLSVVPGTSYTVTVGGQRNGVANNGQQGNPSWFGTAATVYAEGGAGGAAPNNGRAGGIGSAASSIGDVVFAGGDGADGTTTLGGGGGGGAGSTGDGGDASGTTAGNGTTENGGNGAAGRGNGEDGYDGNLYGGGGGGAYVNNNTNRSGGNGAAGFVRVTYTMPVFYSQGSVAPNTLANWNTNPGGGGASPTNFAAANQIFVVQTGHTMTTTATWNISGANTILRIQNGGVLNENNNITLAATGTLEIENGGTLNHNVNAITIFGGTEIFGNTSVVNYGFAGAQAIIAANYGNLTVSGGNTKTLQGDITVNNTLLLANGNLSLGSGTSGLTLANGATVTATGGFSNGRMIVCDGSGSLIKESASAAGFVMVYPLGTGTYYSPFEITAFTGTITGTGSINIRAVAGTAPGPPAANSTDLQKYWAISTSNLTGIDFNAGFSYVSPDEVGTGGDQASYVPYRYTGSDWLKAPGGSSGGINPMTVANNSILDGVWTGRETPTTYYSYQSGNWEDALTWTTDPSGTLSVSPAVPGTGDRVVVLNGRTVTVNAPRNVLSVQINDGGFLDIGTTTGHDFGVVRGEGRLRLSGGTFPGGVFDEFVSAGGGTVEYYNNAGFTFSQLEYNNLILNLNTDALIATLANNLLTINGNFTITRGRFQINDATANSRMVTVSGDVYISDNGSIRIGTGNVNHSFIVNGNFTNDGSVRLTNQAAPQYTATPNNGRADLVFNNPSADQFLVCNGLTDLYRLEIDKGVDQTYILHVDASDPSFFALYGRNNLAQSTTPPAITNPNALGLLAGTVRLGNNIVLPSLSSNSTFSIDEDARIWLDGANLTYSEQANTADGTALILYGGLRVSVNSVLDDNSKQGIVSRTTASFLIEGGTINTECVRTSYQAGTHRGAFTMTDGVLTIRGAELPNLGGMNVYATFTLPYPDNTLTISGGTINILSPNPIGGGSGSNFSMVIGANPTNINVTGGTINITVPAARDAYFATTSPFWNLNIISAVTTRSAQPRTYTANGTVPTAIPAQPLIVKNDLALQNSAVLTSGPDNVEVSVGRNFTIPVGTTYTPGTNTTIFNGTSGQTFTNNGTITAGLFNLNVANRSNTQITQNLIVRNNLSVGEGCFLQDMGRIVSVAGQVTNSGTHISQVGGSVTLNGTVNQSIGGSGSGVFGNLVINKTTGTASLSANQALTGNLRLANGLLDIGTYNLTLGTGSNIYDALYPAVTAVFSGTKMIRTSGNVSDGGVTKTYNSTTSFTFPVGTANDYTPATIQFNAAPTAWGGLNVKPVAQFNPFVTSANSLNYYWKVTQQGFAGITSVSHNYRYVDSDLTGRGNEANYIPGVYNPYSWVYINDISQVIDGSNEIRFTNVAYAEGDFTAGEINAFQPVTVYYSCTSGDWDQLSTWSTVSNAGPANATALPGANNPVVIGDGAANNHFVTVPAGFNNILTGGLQVNSGSILDITITTGHNFGVIPDSKVTGTGTLRISSGAATATFPGGDFGNFLASGGGTVVYYTTGAQDFVVPATKVFYNNLTIAPGAGRYISMPNIDLQVLSNLEIAGTDITAVTRLNVTASRTLSVEGNLNVNSGTLQYYNGTVQTVLAKNDINIAAGAAFNVRNGGTAVTNLLYIEGNLNNNGAFDMNTSATLFANTYFIGNTNKVISGTGTNDFNILYVDKGNSRNTILDVTANNLSLSYTGGAALVLDNGTFRVSNSSLAFTLSTTTAFTIPTTAALSVNEGSVTIGTNSNAGDLILAGRLEVINNGIVGIGTGANYNNDIEYASGGNPEIILAGNGRLNVTGQIRRPTTISSGALSYTQSGNSQLLIYGRQADNSRAMFEVLNTGSNFNMSGGILSIYRNFNNPASFELYLVPDNSAVTGGEILIGSTSTVDGTEYNIASSVPLWDVTVNVVSNIKIVNQRIFPLIIQNTLTIQGNNVYRANGLDLSIGNSLVNGNSNAGTGVNTGGFQPGTLTQVTRFNGLNAQYITGAAANLTNFANLVVEPSTSLTLSANTNIRVNNDLTINSGTFNDGSNEITLAGDVYNAAAHLSPTINGGIIFNSIVKQTISGSGYGVFGNILLNNSLGVDMVDNTVINGRLTFGNGNLYIDDYLLTFGTNASVGGTSNADNMILLNGVISDQGVKKLFPASASDFTFPIGVAGKYTPASYNVTSNTAAGSITVRPVNRKHPSTSENPALTNELQYYWYVQESGFSGLTVNHEYQYINDDALPNETDYVVGRFNPVTYSWSAPVEGTVNAASDNFTITGVDYIDGEYTCGVNSLPSPNFLDLPIYYSRNTTSGGNWTNPASWTLNSDGTGGPAPSYPQGNPVVILAGHTVTLDANDQVSFSVELYGTLTVGTTLYHSLGHIRGSGTIHITSTASGSFIFPAGVYDEFMANSSSTIEFYNNSVVPATLPLKPGNDYKPYQNVIFSGTGIKYMSAENLRVLGNLTINAGTLNNTLHNRTLTILGNWVDNNTGATGGFVPGTGLVVFKGTTAQTLTVAGATTVEQFYKLQVNNASGLALSGAGSVNVNRYLYLTLGNITTNTTNILRLTYPATNAVIGGGSTSFVNGPLQKRINAGSYFNFPTGNGNGTRYGNLYLSSVSATGDYIAQYYNHNPGDDGYDPASVVVPVDAVSNSEYWRVNGPAATANVRVRWDDQSGIIPADAGSRSKLRIVEWNGAAWENRGNVVADGGVSYGTIQTSPLVSVNGNHIFTVGVESLPTATIISGNSAMCDDGSSADIVIELTGTAPWTIRYMVDGGNETTINNIASSPYTLVVSNAIEPLASQGPGDYSFNVSYIQDATGSTGIRDFTSSVTITLNESPEPVINGNTTVGIGETGVVYSSGTANLPGHTYSWTVSPGAVIASGNGTYQISVNWPAAYGTGWVRLTETVTAGGCSITTDQYEVEITDIPNPNVTGPDPVCNEVTVIYRTARVGTHTYSWSLPLGGGTIVGATDRDSVVVNWSSTGNYSVRADETGSVTRDNTLNVLVNPLPGSGNEVTDPEVCMGQTANIIVVAADAGLSLQLYRQLDDVAVGGAVSSGPGGNITLSAVPVASTNYYIVATNEYLCSAEITDPALVTVFDLPVVTITGPGNLCEEITATLDAGAGFSSYSWSFGATVLGSGQTQDVTTQSLDAPVNSVVETYTVVVVDSNGCEGTDTHDINVIRIPDTGPQYHIENNWGN
ncbi:MAG: hypothetical protein JXB34_15285 [Bacteroidales bacterium]|nr:hypothetical protein [Bacteroidales bacterium]